MLCASLKRSAMRRDSSKGNDRLYSVEVDLNTVTFAGDGNSNELLHVISCIVQNRPHNNLWSYRHL